MRPQRTMRGMRHLLCKGRGKVYASGVHPTSLWQQAQGQVILRGEWSFFTRNSLGSLMKTKGLNMEQRLLLLSQWGRRAEDPFRGLRAGPVRYSPFTFADRRAGYASGPRRNTPYHPGHTRTRRKCVQDAICSRSGFRETPAKLGVVRDHRWGETAFAGLPRLVIRQRQGQQDHKPEDRTDDDELRAPGAVARVHEVEDDEGGLDRGNSQSNNNIERAKILKCRPHRGARAHHQQDEDDKVDFPRNNMLGHA